MWQAPVDRDHRVEVAGDSFEEVAVVEVAPTISWAVRTSWPERLLRKPLGTQASRRTRTSDPRARQAADAHDLALINKHANALNAEADDVLVYQGDL